MSISKTIIDKTNEWRQHWARHVWMRPTPFSSRHPFVLQRCTKYVSHTPRRRKA